MDEHTFSRPLRRIGYAITIVVNLAVLWIVNNLLGWEWFPWLTEEFAEVLPWINVSILATILSSVLFLIVRNPAGLRGPVEIVTTATSLAAAARILAVFPFDFEAYAFPWEFAVRALLILVIVATTIGLVVQVVTLVRRIVG